MVHGSTDWWEQFEIPLTLPPDKDIKNIVVSNGFYEFEFYSYVFDSWKFAIGSYEEGGQFTFVVPGWEYIFSTGEEDKHLIVERFLDALSIYKEHH
jgi:hypothetical protein